jgi:glycosyltransferase involved in cell wall biosynthesis
VSQYYYPEQFRITDICETLVEKGHEVTVLTGLPNYPSGIIPNEYKGFRKRDETHNNVNIIRASIIGRGTSKIQLVLNYLSFAVSATFRVLSMPKEYDIVLVYQLSPVMMSIPGLLMKKIIKKPLVIYSHDLWPESIVSFGIKKSSITYKFVLKLSNYIYNGADKILISSSNFLNYFRDVIKYKGPIHYLPVYAESLFEHINLIEKNDKQLDLVFAGNIGEMQSVDTIINTANRLNEFKHIKFHIVGDGSARNKCEKLVRSFGLNNVIFYGNRPLKEMPKFYELADAFLITLKTNEIISYTLPNKMQSYLAAGKPVLGCIDGETRDVIEKSQCGLCCKSEDDMAFATIIREFDKNRMMHTIYAANAKDYYRSNFSRDIFFERLNEIMKNYSE